MYKKGLAGTVESDMPKLYRYTEKIRKTMKTSGIPSSDVEVTGSPRESSAARAVNTDSSKFSNARLTSS